MSKDRNEAQINGQGERFLKAVELARLYPTKPVWFAGYSGQLFQRGWSKDEITKKLILQFGLKIERFSFETDSRNTSELAQNMYGLVTHDATKK